MWRRQGELLASRARRRVPGTSSRDDSFRSGAKRRKEKMVLYESLIRHGFNLGYSWRF